MFELYAKKLNVLTGYEADLARWKATKICERCAATFMDVSLRIPKAAAMSFCFVGQERRCPHCKSYFWKVPEAVADEHEATANAELNRAKQQLHEVEQAAIIAAKKPVPKGFLAKLAASLRFAPMSPERARAMLDEATRAHRSSIDKVNAMRSQARSRTDARWCVECKTIYPGVFAPPSMARSCNPA